MTSPLVDTVLCILSRRANPSTKLLSHSGCRQSSNAEAHQPFGSLGAALMFLGLCYVIAIFSVTSLARGQSVRSPSSIGGSVVDSNGDSVEAAKATLRLLPNGPAIIQYTDSSGSFIFSDLKAGNYQVSASKAGFVEASREVSLNDNEKSEFTLSLRPGGRSDSISITGGEAERLQGFNGMARLDEISGLAIYSGMKNEVLVLSQLNANTATGNTRQVFGKVPGTNIWENDGSGLQIGVSNRGLDPNRSWEMNSRQNGYDISADIFGYPEAYFTPPLDAVERIEVVRGASALQYGAQFGGLVNYILKEAPGNRRFTFATEQTGGPNGLFNSHNRTGGSIGKLIYNGYYQHRQGDGWRDNSGFNANTGFESLKYQANERLSIKLELTEMKYLLQMAGGLTDKLFKENARASVRDRNWFSLKWLVPALKFNYEIDASTKLSLDVFGLRGTRYSLFNSTPVAFPTGELNLDDPSTPRTFFKDRFHNHGLEVRFLKHYKSRFGLNSLAAGFRYSNGKTVRQQGVGFPGTEPKFEWLVPNVDRNLHFRNINLAGFAENIFRITQKLSITPGVRFDFIDSSARGRPIVATEKRTRTIPLLGMGVSYQVSGDTNLYGNISQAYRATLFNDFWRPDPTIIVDPNLKDMRGYVCEFGWRGRRGNWLSFDVGGFYLKYRDRLGLLTREDPQAKTVSLWTNISDSRNVGIESFVEADVLRLARVGDGRGSLSVFGSIAKIDAHYLGGRVRGNRVELAPKSIIRTGSTYHILGFSATLQYSRVGDQFSDATNTLFTVDAVQGLIPAYQVWDFSGGYRFQKYYVIRAGVNNLADARYFTRRALSYPGPGLIPADGRSFYLSMGLSY